MDNPASQQQESEQQQSSGITAALQILDRIENWLASVFEFTEEEQENAGVYLDNQRYE
jgi:hypothetical protein